MSEQAIIPEDRTIRTPARAICRNPECQEPGKRRFEFSVKHGAVECPKCSASKSPMICLMVLTHLLVKDPDGMIQGDHGWKYKLACDKTRAYLATATNLEAATACEDVYNCPHCAEYILKNKNSKSLLETTRTEQLIKENKNV